MNLATFRRCSWRQAFVAALVPALLAAQSLGLLHGITHSPHGTVPGATWYAPVHVGAHDADHSHGHDDKHVSFLSALWSGHEDAGDDCRIFDQLSHGDLAPLAPVPALPLALPTFLLSLLSGLATARWHAAFQARGPPLVR